MEDLEEVTTLSGHEFAVTSVAFVPEQEQVISGSLDTTVRVWDLENGAELYRFSGHSDAVFSVDISPNGSTAASGSWEDVRVWDFETAQELVKLKGHKWPAMHLFFGKDGKLLFTGGADSTMFVWDISNRKGE